MQNNMTSVTPTTNQIAQNGNVVGSPIIGLIEGHSPLARMNSTKAPMVRVDAQSKPMTAPSLTACSRTVDLNCVQESSLSDAKSCDEIEFLFDCVNSPESSGHKESVGSSDTVSCNEDVVESSFKPRSLLTSALIEAGVSKGENRVASLPVGMTRRDPVPYHQGMEFTPGRPDSVRPGTAPIHFLEKVAGRLVFSA